MLSVLGIDAAWTAISPSGVALLKQSYNQWNCLALAPSYYAFIELAKGVPVDWEKPPCVGAPNPASLLDSAAQLLDGESVSVVTVDMPIATTPINGRRKADDDISIKYGSRKCGTHSPTKQRPGTTGTTLYNGFIKAGYPLATTITQGAVWPKLVEVYPHPALLTLTNSNCRRKYKVSKSKKFWPELNRHSRINMLLLEYDHILTKLKQHINQIPLFLPHRDNVNTLSQLKRYEDSIDALICAWVGIKYLAGEIHSFGDATAAIWTPATSP